MTEPLRTLGADTNRNEQTAFGQQGQELENPFDLLPQEILFSIFEQLGRQSENAVMLACRRFSAVMGNIRNIRLLQQGIEDATGNLLENVEPDTRILEHIGGNIFSIALMDLNTAKLELNKIFYRIRSKPYSLQNFILSSLIDAWIINKGEGPDREWTFKKLFQALYLHSLCNKANKIHIASLVEENGVLNRFTADIRSWNPRLKEEHKVGILCPEDLSFQFKAVADSLIPSLAISGDNTFLTGEIVAVNHKGSLLGNRKKLWYGIVVNKEETEGEPLYTVSPYCLSHVRNAYIYSVKVSAIALGKIPSAHDHLRIIRS